MTATTLIEHVADWRAGMSVERDERLVRNVALAGLESRNGYRYSDAALREAARLYEHKPVFLDHAADTSRPQERSTRDLVGSVVHPRYEEGRIRGDIRVLDTESGRTFLALVEDDTPGVGMSHVVLAERSADGATVERIRDVVSVDAVVGPATTRTFRESREQRGESSGRSGEAGGESGGVHRSDRSCEGTGDSECGSETVRTVSAPVLLHDQTPASPFPHTSAEATTGKAVHREIEVLREELAMLTSERDALREKVDQIEAAAQLSERRQSVATLLAEAELPEYARTDAFVRQLEGSADDEARRELIRERVALVQRAARTGPVSAERGDGRDRAAETARFVSAIRQRRRA
jgi:hypothetical protein